jgi:hypothetical protein
VLPLLSLPILLAGAVTWKDTSRVVYEVDVEAVIVPEGSVDGLEAKSKSLADTLPPLLLAVIVYEYLEAEGVTVAFTV